MECLGANSRLGQGQVYLGDARQARNKRLRGFLVYSKKLRNTQSMALRITGLRIVLATLLVFAATGGVVVWDAYQKIDRYREQAQRVADLRKQRVKISTRPANVPGYWSRLPGVEPDIFQEVTEVEFPSTMVVSDFTLRPLAGMTELETLRCPNSTITDEGAKLLHDLPKLVSLELTSSKLTDAIAESIAKRSTLKHLTLKGSEIGDASVKAIAALPHLESLALQGSRIDDQGLASLAKLSSLKRLSLSGTYSDEGLEKLAGCGQLEWLELFALGATDRTLRALQSLPHLQTLMIAEGAYTDDAVLALKNRPQMELFSCQGASIAATPAKQQALEMPPFAIRFQWDTPDPDRFYEFGGFADEINLVVGSEWTGEDWDIAYGAAFKDVTDVNINSPRVHDRGIARLVRFGKKLQSLTIGDAAITPAVTDYLARMPMQWLSLSGAKIDDSWAPALEQLTNVKRLELVNTRVSPEIVEKLKAAGVKVIARSKKQSSPQEAE